MAQQHSAFSTQRPYASDPCSSYAKKEFVRVLAAENDSSPTSNSLGFQALVLFLSKYTTLLSSSSEDKKGCIHVFGSGAPSLVDSIIDLRGETLPCAIPSDGKCVCVSMGSSIFSCFFSEQGGVFLVQNNLEYGNLSTKTLEYDYERLIGTLRSASQDTKRQIVSCLELFSGKVSCYDPHDKSCIMIRDASTTDAAFADEGNGASEDTKKKGRRTTAVTEPYFDLNRTNTIYARSVKVMQPMPGGEDGEADPLTEGQGADGFFLHSNEFYYSHHTLVLPGEGRVKQEKWCFQEAGLDEKEVVFVRSSSNPAMTQVVQPRVNLPCSLHSIAMTSNPIEKRTIMMVVLICTLSVCQLIDEGVFQACEGFEGTMRRLSVGRGLAEIFFETMKGFQKMKGMVIRPAVFEKGVFQTDPSDRDSVRRSQSAVAVLKIGVASLLLIEKASVALPAVGGGEDPETSLLPKTRGDLLPAPDECRATKTLTEGAYFACLIRKASLAMASDEKDSEERACNAPDDVPVADPMFLMGAGERADILVTKTPLLSQRQAVQLSERLLGPHHDFLLGLVDVCGSVLASVEGGASKKDELKFFLHLSLQMQETSPFQILKIKRIKKMRCELCTYFHGVCRPLRPKEVTACVRCDEACFCGVCSLLCGSVCPLCRTEHVSEAARRSQPPPKTRVEVKDEERLAKRAEEAEGKVKELEKRCGRQEETIERLERTNESLNVEAGIMRGEAEKARKEANLHKKRADEGAKKQSTLLAECRTMRTAVETLRAEAEEARTLKKTVSVLRDRLDATDEAGRNTAAENCQLRYQLDEFCHGMEDQKRQIESLLKEKELATRLGTSEREKNSVLRRDLDKALTILDSISSSA